MFETKFVNALIGGIEKDALELLEKITDVNARFRFPSGAIASYIMIASQKSTGAVIEALIKRGAKISDKDEQGRNLLHIAQSLNNISTTQKLLELDPTLRVQGDLKGNTPLHSAVIYRKSDMLELYLSDKWPFCSVNVRNNNGETPLYVATDKAFRAGAFILLENGADPLLANRKGESPYDIARSNDILPDLTAAVKQKVVLSLFGIAAAKAKTFGLLSAETIPQKDVLQKAEKAANIVESIGKIRAEEKKQDELIDLFNGFAIS